MTDLQKRVLYKFYVKQSTDFLDECTYDSFFNFLLQIPADDIVKVIVAHRGELEKICTKNIPQFSEKKDMYKALKVLIASGSDTMTYNELGYYLCKVDRKPEAKRKYAENHYMLAVQMGFALDTKPLEITTFGKAFNLLPDDRTRDEIMKRLCLKVPVLQQILLQAHTEYVDVVEFLSGYLAPTTVLRRRSNIHTFLNWLRTISQGELLFILNRIKW